MLTHFEGDTMRAVTLWELTDDLDSSKKRKLPYLQEFFFKKLSTTTLPPDIRKTQANAIAKNLHYRMKKIESSWTNMRNREDIKKFLKGYKFHVPHGDEDDGGGVQVEEQKGDNGPVGGNEDADGGASEGGGHS